MLEKNTGQIGACNTEMTLTRVSFQDKEQQAMDSFTPHGVRPASGTNAERKISELDIAVGRYAALIISNNSYPDNARLMHQRVSFLLEKNGFYVENEFPTRVIGDDKAGRIDIVASYKSGSVAIELDCRRPRTRSLKKLRLFDGYRLIALRGVGMFETPRGVDQVVCARVIA
jgi:hypothetical protein